MKTIIWSLIGGLVFAIPWMYTSTFLDNFIPVFSVFIPFGVYLGYIKSNGGCNNKSIFSI